MKLFQATVSNNNKRTRAAFTLIELLIVLSIMVTLSGMIISAFGEESIESRLMASARELQSTMIKARTLAKRTDKAYAISFNVLNSGNGAVLKNYSSHTDDARGTRGGHWYILVGPDNTGTTRSMYYPPKTWASNRTSDINSSLNGTARVFEQSVKTSQIGPVHYLQEGIRFLALSDSTYGHYGCSPAYTSGLFPGATNYADISDTYPRAWYGYFDRDTQKYYPWGAYNPEIDASTDLRINNYKNANNVLSGVTGFNYASCDGPIAYNATLDCNIHPDTVHGRLYGNSIGARSCHPGHKGDVDGVSSAFNVDNAGAPRFDPEKTYTGKARPLLDAYTFDFVMFFLPDGQVIYEPVSLIGTRHMLYEYEGDTSNRNSFGRFKGAIAPYVDRQNTGGYHITLARDIIEEDDSIYTQMDPVTEQFDYSSLQSADDALQSISPYCRVFINATTAESTIKKMTHPDCLIQANDLEQK
ncbi:MAG: type II secretion system protein [Planctomycetes bacterium]|nr:type II secretion system protein [Planctomycetota bacterium]